jgi:hypothetical protein
VRAAPFLLAAACALQPVRSAQAYVSTRTNSGTAVRWPTRCIVIAPDARGDISSDDIDANAIDATLARATENWNARMKGCSFMQLGVVPATRALEAVSDGRPALVFRSDVWGRGDKMYDPSAIGVTTVWFADRPGDPADGQITDADIELNAVNYSFTNQPATAQARVGTKVADLENTLTHELGHVMGLAHTCWDHKTDTPPPDETGAPAPDCNATNLPPKVTMATMFPYADERAVNMRVVGDDDLKGVCDTYPMNDTPPACYAFIVESGGCAMPQPRDAPAHTARNLAIALAVGAALLALKRRRP